MNPYLIIAALVSIIAAFVAGDIEGKKNAHTADALAVETLKAQAASTLANETKAKLDAQTQLSNLISKAETDRETQQIANRADLRKRTSGPRLQFFAEAPGRGAGGDSAQGPALGTTADPAGAAVQLPRKINDDLFEFAADAESLKIDYRVLFDYVHNPKLVCELQP